MYVNNVWCIYSNLFYTHIAYIILFYVVKTLLNCTYIYILTSQNIDIVPDQPINFNCGLLPLRCNIEQLFKPQ